MSQAPPSAPSLPSVAIVGAGSVGATLAYACLLRGVARRLSLYDVSAAKVAAETLDLNHGLQFVPGASLDGSDDIEICRGAEVVVITAGAKQKPGQTRMDLAEANVGMCRQLVPRLLELAPRALFLLVTNPVDVVTAATLAVSGLPRERVIGSGTVLDSSRFRFLIARRCGVAVQNVHAYIAGEHGDSAVPLWTSASVGGVPLMEWGGGSFDEPQRRSLFEQVRSAAYRIVSGKGATNYAVGLAAARILEAILGDERLVMPVSTRIDGQHGIRGVCLSLPCLVGRDGAGPPLPLPMSDAERAALESSAEVIRKALRALGL